MTGSASIHSRPALLVVEDGRSFRGRAFGAPGETFGELVFSTGMSGYQETLTDPSYRGQVVLMTAPHIGNTGWNDEDLESSRIWVSGLIARDPAVRPSNWRSARTLQEEMVAQGIVGISDVDTRALTRHIRDKGSMRVGISTLTDDPQDLLHRVLDQPRMAGANLVADVTTALPYVVEPTAAKRLRVVALDLGMKSMTPLQMAARGIEVHVLPAHGTFEDVWALQPDGVFFSNGPGDPATADGPVALLEDVLRAQIPFFGICFGHQLFGRALGLDTYKLKFGHRGINQPVLDNTTGRVEVTAHNHGFAVASPDRGEARSPYGTVAVSHICLNDDVVEGLELRRGGDLVGFSVQYHPEAAAGPHDANYLFDRFVDMLVAGKEA